MRKQITDLWHELRRRRVVGTAAGYAATAFALLQLGEIVFPAFGMGEGALRVLLAVLVAAFPIVLALSWVFDVTRSGLRVTPPTQPVGAAPVRPRRGAVVGLVLVAAGALGWGGWWAVRSAGAPGGRPDRVRSIAVLPFADLSGGGNQTYLGDGLADEILNSLASVDSLQVAARTSSFVFRDRNRDARDIARTLNVAAILEGTVRRGGDHVRVTARLIDGRTGFEIWSGDFDRAVSDLLSVQDSVADAIVKELTGQLALSGRRAGKPVPAAAQEAYWRARAQWSRRDPSALPGAISLFQQAISIDPQYAAAYAGLADSYALMPVLLQSMAPPDALVQAQNWARKAIALDSALADPWASLGLVRAMDQDRVGALDALSHAIDLNPSYAPALHWRANVLADMGQLVAARHDAEKAARLDPLSAPVATDYASIMLWSGNAEGARTEVQRALSLDFSYRPALFLNVLLSLNRDQDVSLQMSLTQWAVLCGVPAASVPPLADAMLRFRKTGEAVAPPAVLRGLAPQPGIVTAGTIASLYALVGARKDMLTWLRRAATDGSWADEYISVNPVFDPFRSDPEFKKIVMELG